MNGIWTFHKLDVVVILLFIWYLCQVIMLINNQTHPKVVTTTVMPTKLEVSGAQKWISWKPTLMPGTQLHTLVTVLLVNTTGTVTEEAVEKLFIKLMLMHMDQEVNTESTLNKSSMLKFLSTRVEAE